jgi:hypothetical protein
MRTQTHSKGSNLSRRARVIVFAGAFIIAAAAPAFAYWVVSVAYANGNFAQASADTLPTGSTPTAAVTPSGNSNTIGLTFATSSLTSSGRSVTTYVINRYATGSSTPSNTFTCTPGVGAFTCTEGSVPDGSWQYTDTPAISGTSWVGTPGPMSASVVVDTTPPTSMVTFPAQGAYYNNAGWSSACNVAPFNSTNSICGTATDLGAYPSGVASVAVSIESTSGSTSGKYWGGSSFNQSSEVKLAASYSGGNWTLAFPSTDFSSDGSYVVRSYATDSDGNIQSSATSASFNIDNTAPTASTPIAAASVKYGSNPMYVDEETVNLTDAPTDSGTGIKSVSYYYCAGSSGSCVSGIPWTFIGSSSVSSGGYAVSWNAPLPADGPYEIVATATDNAGNTSASSSSVLVAVDTTAPTVPQPGVNGYT